jgi:hypothetical protein
MDICLAILPWTIIKTMALNRKERLGVLIAMSMGIVAGLTSIAKTATLSGISNPDAQATISLMILATSEIALSIIAASIPALRVLIRNTMKVYSVPHFYRYYRTGDNQSSDNHRSLTRPSPTPDGKSSEFSDSNRFVSPLSSPDSVFKRNWDPTATASVLDPEYGTGVELQNRESPGTPTTYGIADVRKR